VTLRRDAYAATPGPTLGLALGERTLYRAGAWLLDQFDGPALGASYPAWGGTAGLQVVAGAVTPVAVGPVGMVTHTWPVPRDAWVAIELAALAGPSAVVGVLLRADTTTAYRVTATSAGQTVIEQLGAGAATALATVATPWRGGDRLRVELVWTRLRVYREPILIAEVVVPPTVGGPTTWDAAGGTWDAAGAVWDPAAVVGRAASGLEGRHLGLVAGRAVPGDAAAIAAWVGGEARQEFLGVGLDLGDVQQGLGQPATFEVRLTNLAPMGGADRFAALLRHGLNTAGTYDLDRGDVRVLTVIDGAPAPLTAGVGWIDGPGEVTEESVTLAVRGRDAFLTPQLAAGVVAYVPGPPPGGLTPLPPDPCLPSPAPTVIPGAVPPEPVDPPGPGAGLGPEAPPAPADADGGPALAGAWIVTFDYHLELVEGATVYVGTTNVIRLPSGSDPPGSDTPGGGGITITQRDGFQADKQTRITSTGAPVVDGTADFPAYWVETMTYRGPDIAGSQIQRDARWSAGDNPGLYPKAYIPAGTVEAGVEFKLVSYSGATIKSEADLAALHPPQPGTDPRPGRIATLATWTGNVTLQTAVCSPDPHADAAWFQVTTPAGGVVGPVSPFSAGPVTGPQFFRIEITSAPVPSTVAVRANLFTRQPGTDANVFAGSGPCGAGLHHFRTLATPADMSGFSVR